MIRKAESIIAEMNSIQERIHEVMDLPEEISRCIVEISSYISTLAAYQVSLKKRATEEFLQYRQEGKTIKDSEMLMKSGENYCCGKLIELKTDAAKEMINSLKKRLEVLHNEQKNCY